MKLTILNRELTHISQVRRKLRFSDASQQLLDVIARFHHRTPVKQKNNKAKKSG